MAVFPIGSNQSLENGATFAQIMFLLEKFYMCDRGFNCQVWLKWLERVSLPAAPFVKKKKTAESNIVRWKQKN